MPAALLRVHPVSPEPRKIDMILDVLRHNGVIIVPTDAVYALGCSVHSPRAVASLGKIRKMAIRDALFTLTCLDMSQASAYLAPIPNPVFRAIQRHSPGSFTFILPASVAVSKLFDRKRKTIGVRFPENPILIKLLEKLEGPLLSASLHNAGDEIQDYYTDPITMHDDFLHAVDLVVDGGAGGLEPTTLMDFTQDEWQIVRQGKGIWKG